MAFHTFCTDDAEKYGIECAAILWNIGFWCTTNLTRRQNIRDGYVWTYNTAAAFLELQPYLCPAQPTDGSPEAEHREQKRRERKVYRLLQTLEDKGAILKAQFDKGKHDRKTYYALADQNQIMKHAQIKPEVLNLLKRQKCHIEDTDLSHVRDKNVTSYRSINNILKTSTTTTTEAVENFSIPEVSESPEKEKAKASQQEKRCKHQDGTYTEYFKDFASVFKIAFAQLANRDGMIPVDLGRPGHIWLGTKCEAIFDRLIEKGKHPDPYDIAALCIKDWLDMTGTYVGSPNGGY